MWPSSVCRGAPPGRAAPLAPGDRDEDGQGLTRQYERMSPNRDGRRESNRRSLSDDRRTTVMHRLLTIVPPYLRSPTYQCSPANRMSDAKDGFRKHRHLTVVFVLALLPIDAFSDITDSLLYQTVLTAHLADVAEFISIVGVLKAKGAEPPVLSNNPDKPIERFEQFIDWITENCSLQPAPQDNKCYHRIARLRLALDHSDYLSWYLHRWMDIVISNWEELDTFGPEEARELPHILPLPYSYKTVGRVAEYEPEYRQAVRPGPIRHDARPILYQELSYAVNTTPRYRSESSSLPVAVADFIVNRASQEMLYGLLTKFVIEPDEDGSDFVEKKAREHLEYFAPAMISVFETLQYSQIDTLVPALRSAAAVDIIKTPARLIVYTKSAKEENDLRRIHYALEMVRSGLRPDVAMSRIPRADGQCDTLDIARTLAMEWHLSKGRIEKDGNGSMSDQVRIGGYTFSVVLEQPDLFNAFMRRYIAERPEFDCGTPTRPHTDAELENFVLEAFERLRQLDALLERAASAGSADVDLSDVLRLTSEFFVFSSERGGGVASKYGRNWMEDWLSVYLAAANYNFSETVSAALRYVSNPLVTTQQSDETGRVVPLVLRLITLGANLAEAETSEEFQAVLYAAADPVGSFVTKRQPEIQQLTVGAYLGGVVGGERKLAGGDENWAGHFGLALPIGLEWSVGLGGGGLLRSFGVFVSPVDLGAIASYRVHDLSGGPDSFESAEFGWRQLLSPSVYLVFGLFDDLPLSIGGGVQYAPWARKHHDGSKEMRMIDAIRVSMLLAVDVALLRLWSGGSAPERDDGDR